MIIVMYNSTILIYRFIRRTFLIAALLWIIGQPFPNTSAENRNLLPENQKQELSEFYHYLRGRYSQSSTANGSDQNQIDAKITSKDEINSSKIGQDQTESTSSTEKQTLSNQEIEKHDKSKLTKSQELQKIKQPRKNKIPDNKITNNKNNDQQTKTEIQSLRIVEPTHQLVATRINESVEPTKIKRSFSKPAPDFYRGLYINNAFVRSNRFEKFLLNAKKHNINTLVIDIQPRLPSKEVIELAEENGFYLIARVVVFSNGLATYPASNKHLANVINRAEEGAKLGFAEIQLDYIRFADNLHIKGLTLAKRYQHISNILGQFENQLRPYKVRIGADIFGRIPFNKNDIIGQQLELFDHHLDVINPMLYPSHFYGDFYRRSKPYNTILDGTLLTKKRVKNSRVIPYIQAFGMKVSDSGLSVENYIRAQLDAAVDSGGAGYIAWNARNDYHIFFKAIQAGRFIKPKKTE